MSNFKYNNIDQNTITLKEVLVIKNFYISSGEVGQIISVKDGVAKVSGLFNVLSGEMVNLNTFFKIKGMVLSLENTTVSVVIFGNDTLLKQGDYVYRK
jgi:F0F1-type ATP synthase alpha subunit